MKKSNMAASVHQRLCNLASEKHWDHNLLFARYGVERLLYRLASSPHADRFLLKGAMLFIVWEGAPHRSTRDLDLLGLQKRSEEELVKIFQEIAAVPVEPDGLTFETVTAEMIRAGNEAGGIRVKVKGHLGGGKVDVQVDVGFGDATVPAPVEIEFPTLLGMPSPRLRAYPPETVIAEKLEAMVSLGLTNSRMKDFFDIWHLSKTSAFEGAVLVKAIQATFAARGTKFPQGEIIALSPDFAHEPSKVTQWNAFVRQAMISGRALEFPALIQDLRKFLIPLVESIQRKHLPQRWSPERGYSGMSHDL
jgi:hypothetical protein